MECHACATPAAEGQKFCQECGQSLSGVTDSTEQYDPNFAAGAAAPPGDAAGVEPSGSSGVAPEPDVEVGADVEDVDVDADIDADGTPIAGEAVLPSIADLPTREINPREPLPDPSWAPTEEVPATAAGAAAVDAGPEVFDDLTTPTPAHPMAAVDGATPDTTLADLGAAPPDDGLTQPLAAPGATPTDELDTDQVAAVGAATTVLAATDLGTTDEFPAVFDGSGDVVQFPAAREPFKLRLMFVLGFFGAIATVMSSAADLIDIRTSRPVDGIATGIRTLQDFGVNLPVAGFTGAAVMALGGLLACFGFRWGAGLAGGGGLAVAGWAALSIGLAEVPIAIAESVTRRPTAEQFTLTVTRDLGFWLIVSAGAIGLIVFAASLRLAGTGGHRSLNPWVAAVGAVSAVILAAGPLIPEGNASFSDNFRSPDVLIDLPSAYFGGRLGQVALIGFAGVVGFLLVRTYGLGLVAGGISVAVWMWISALLGIGEDLVNGDEPLGVAAGNFGAGDTTPHGVTTVGMVLTLLLLLVSAVMATVQYRRDARRF